ncbi:MAG: hypothetical protein WC280_01250 [Patescibacteria group bacterium]
MKKNIVYIFLIIALAAVAFIVYNNKKDINMDGPSVAESCQFFGGTWLEDFNECEYIDNEWCLSFDGIFNECGSACRNNPEAEMCTLQCVSFCEIK